LPGGRWLSTQTSIRPFVEAGAPQAWALFIAVNRLVAPPRLHNAFEAYIPRSPAKAINRIEVYRVDPAPRRAAIGPGSPLGITSLSN
jgi:hypothetical protein